MVDLDRIMARVSGEPRPPKRRAIDLDRIMARILEGDVIAEASGVRGTVRLLSGDRLEFSRKPRGIRNPRVRFVDARNDAKEGWAGFQILGENSAGNTFIYGYVQCYPARFSEEPAGVPEYAECRADFAKLKKRLDRPRLRMWYVGLTFIPATMRGFGFGRLLYEQMLVVAARRGAVLAPDNCMMYGTTSKLALRVWNSLAARHTHEGHVIVREDELPKKRRH